MKHAAQDLFILGLSLFTAYLIVQFNVVHEVLEWTGDGVWIASFFAGMFFTSVVTTAPAIAVLGELTLEGNIFLVAVLGAMGAVIGDYLIFAFVRDRISDDIADILGKKKTKRFRSLFRRKTFKWLLPFLGGLIIASPLPDELGLSLLGMTKMKTKRFILISFSFNALGILLIGLVARSF